MPCAQSTRIGGTHVLLVFFPDFDLPRCVSRDEVTTFAGTLNEVESGYVALVTRQRPVHACRQFVLIVMASSQLNQTDLGTLEAVVGGTHC